MGRPTTYSEDLALHICERLSGDPPETLRKICADPKMPHRATVFRWLDEHPEFKTFYAYAMQAKVEGYVEEIVEIADDGSRDIVLSGEDAAGMPIATVDKEVLARTKLRIEARQWIAGVSMPRKYGALIGQAPEILPPGGTAGDGAKVINPAEPTVIENDPLHAELMAWERAARG